MNLPLKEEARRFQGREQYLQSQGSMKEWARVFTEGGGARWESGSTPTPEQSPPCFDFP